jgi:dienelactone hydrolase
MKRILAPVTLAAALLASTALAGCTPTGRYYDEIFSSAAKTTVVFASAPDLLTGAPVSLRLDAYQPVGDTLAARPAIVWIHGGGFSGGSRTNLATVSDAWARKGYVTFSIDYRLDPGNRCQAVQDGKITDPVELATETERCRRAIVAAHEDSLTAIRWVRANAAAYGVDTTRIAVGGGSAGATTAINVAQWSNPGLGPVPADVEVGAALAMSGCQYDPTQIDANDAPISFLASGFDEAVPFECVTATADAAEAVGTPVERIYYPSESGHAQALYRQHQAEIDPLWEAFLVTHLDL